MSDERLTLPGPDGTRLALEDVQRTVGEVMAIAFDVVPEKTEELAAALFPALDPLVQGARPAKRDARPGHGSLT